MKQMNKKGAIEITATAIVVFIIAIVVLGAVIYLVQSFFPDIGDIFEKQKEQLKQTLRPQLKSGQKIIFDFGDEIRIKSGAKKEIYLGIQNDYANKADDSICFRVALKCVKPFNTKTDKCQGTLVGGVDISTGNPADSDNKWFGAENLLESWSIKNNDFDVKGPIALQPRVNSDIYSMVAEVYKAKDDKSCSENPEFEKYHSKQFSLIVQ